MGWGSVGLCRREIVALFKLVEVHAVGIAVVFEQPPYHLLLIGLEGALAAHVLIVVALA